MNKYLHKKELNIPLYRGKLVIIFTNCSHKLKGLIPYHDEESDLYAHTWSTEWKKKHGFVIVLNFDNEYRKIYNGVIAHEASHAAHFIAEERGIAIDPANDEPITYLIEWIVDEVYKFMGKHGMKAVN